MPTAELDKTHALTAPGQGNQTIGMGLDLSQRSDAARIVWEKSAEALRPHLGFDFKELVWHGTRDGVAFDADPKEAEKKAFRFLTNTENAQPAIIIDGAARFAALRESGQLGSPYYYSGYSLGLATILHAVGSLSTEAAVQLGKGRGDAFKYAIEREPETTMLALIGLESKVLTEVTDKYNLETCLISTDQQRVMGGLVENVRGAVDHLTNLGITRGVKSLEGFVDAAFHSKYFAKAVPDFTEVVYDTKIDLPENGVLIGASVEAKQLLTIEDIRQSLISQLTNTENWASVIRYLWASGVRTMTELNNTPRLVNMNIEMLGGQRPQRLATPSTGEGDRGVTIGQRWLAVAA